MRHDAARLIGSLLATLLLLQWGVGPAACLDHLGLQPGPVLCGSGHPGPEQPDARMAGTCAVCSPVPPSLLPTPPDLPPPRPVQTMLGSASMVVQPSTALPQASPQQPRAPPVRT